MDEREKTWNGVLAASLSIIPGVGHLYLGEKRGYLVLLFAAGLILIWKLGWKPAELLYISVAIFSGADAFSFAKRGHGLM